MREAMHKQRLQQPLHVVERVTHTGEAGNSTDTCVSSTVIIRKRLHIHGILPMRTKHWQFYHLIHELCPDMTLRVISALMWKEVNIVLHLFCIHSYL